MFHNATNTKYSDNKKALFSTKTYNRLWFRSQFFCVTFQNKCLPYLVSLPQILRPQSPLAHDLFSNVPDKNQATVSQLYSGLGQVLMACKDTQ